MAFEIGDKVKIIKKNITAYWNKEMDPTLGLIGTIEKTEGTPCEYYVSFQHGARWWYQGDTLELVKEDNGLLFNPGDKVEVIDNGNFTERKRYLIGKTGTVIEYISNEVYRIDIEGTKQLVRNTALKYQDLKEETKSKFKVGDVVASKTKPSEPFATITRIYNFGIEGTKIEINSDPYAYSEDRFKSLFQLCTRDVYVKQEYFPNKGKYNMNNLNVGDKVKIIPSEQPISEKQKERIGLIGAINKIITEDHLYMIRFDDQTCINFTKIHLLKQTDTEEKETKMATAGNTKREEGLKKATYTIEAPGKNKSNVEIYADTKEKAIYIEYENEDKKLIHLSIEVPERYNIEKAITDITDGIIKIVVPVADGVVIKLL